MDSKQKLQAKRNEMINEVMLMLGHPIIDIELNQDHINLCLNMSLEKWRQGSSNSLEERFALLDLVMGQNEYFLPEEVVQVKKICRRGMTGQTGGTGPYFDPFGAAFATQFALTGFNGTGDLVTFEAFSDYQKMLGKSFGMDIRFTYEPNSKRLELQRDIICPESVILDVYVMKPENIALDDYYSRVWIRDYTVARAKIMLGDIRSKYSSLAGPNGGISLNGESLKSEGLQETIRLETELKSGIMDSIGYGVVTG